MNVSCLIAWIFQLPLTIYGGVRFGRNHNWRTGAIGWMNFAAIVGGSWSIFLTTPAGFGAALLANVLALYGVGALVRLCSPTVRAVRQGQANGRALLRHEHEVEGRRRQEQRRQEQADAARASEQAQKERWRTRQAQAAEVRAEAAGRAYEQLRKHRPRHAASSQEPPTSPAQADSRNWRWYGEEGSTDEADEAPSRESTHPYVFGQGQRRTPKVSGSIDPGDLFAPPGSPVDVPFRRTRPAPQASEVTLVDEVIYVEIPEEDHPRPADIPDREQLDDTEGLPEVIVTMRLDGRDDNPERPEMPVFVGYADGGWDLDSESLPDRLATAEFGGKIIGFRCLGGTPRRFAVGIDPTQEQTES